MSFPFGNRFSQNKVINLTPHAIVIRRDGGEVDLIIEPSGDVARVSISMEYMDDNPVLHAEGGLAALSEIGEEIPCRMAKFGEVSGLPEPVRGTTYLVSAMVAQAVADGGNGRLDVVAPDTGPSAIRNDDGHIVAVRGLLRYV